MSDAIIGGQDRIAKRFAKLREEGRAGLVTFITAGDPDPEASFEILKALPEAGADVIELGMPFTDPMADGPAIQEASIRALAAGMHMRKTLSLVRGFREQDHETPIILMGYYNPIHNYGLKPFAERCSQAGGDGLIAVDLTGFEAAGFAEDLDRNSLLPCYRLASTMNWRYTSRASSNCANTCARSVSVRQPGHISAISCSVSIQRRA